MGESDGPNMVQDLLQILLIFLGGALSFIIILKTPISLAIIMMTVIISISGLLWLYVLSEWRATRSYRKFFAFLTVLGFFFFFLGSLVSLAIQVLFFSFAYIIFAFLDLFSTLSLTQSAYAVLGFLTVMLVANILYLLHQAPDFRRKYRGKIKPWQVAAIALIVLFIVYLTLIYEPPSAPNETDEILAPQYSPLSTNFELLLITQAGSRIDESYSFFVKQALAPLGIAVKIQAIPYRALVNGRDDPVYSTLKSRSPDLVISSLYSPANPYPELGWKYRSNATIPIWGGQVFDFHDPIWQSWQVNDTGIIQSDIEDMVGAIDAESDPLIRRTLINDFNQLFMDQLLYEFPLTTIDKVMAMYRGYGDDDNANTCIEDSDDDDFCRNDLWDQNEGIIRSRALGAKWNEQTTPEYRQADLNTLQLPTVMLPSSSFYNPYLVRDHQTKVVLSPLMEGLLNFDKHLNPHPGIAYNFIEGDWARAETDEVIEGGKISFFLNANQSWKFPSTTTYNGNTVESETVDALDISLALELLKQGPADLFPWYQFKFDNLDHWTINSTVYRNDTITLYYRQRTANDIYNLGNITPLPAHLLAGQLHLDNGTAFNFTRSVFNPLESMEWVHFNSLSGWCLVGPYSPVSAPTSDMNTPYEFAARADYPYPNEADASQMYQDHRANFSSYETSFSLSHFAPHLSQLNPAPYYWNYADNPSTDVIEKPQSQNIEKIIFTPVDDSNARRIKFESGQLDVFQSSTLSAQVVQSDREDQDFVVRTVDSRTTPVTLLFNLENNWLKYRDIRYAIASALDLQDMSSINGNYATPHQSVIASYFDQYRPVSFAGADRLWGTADDSTWYSTGEGIPYSYETARDIFHAMNLSALEDPYPVTTIIQHPGGVVISTIESTNEMVIPIQLIVIPVVLFSVYYTSLRNKKNKNL